MLRGRTPPRPARSTAPRGPRTGTGAPAPTRDLGDPRRLRSGAPCSGGDLAEDRRAVLGAGVFIGDDHHAAALGGHALEHRTLLAVSLPRRAEDDDHGPVPGPAERPLHPA